MQLRLTNIEKSFGSLQVLKNVSFQANSGKSFGLLGRNGAGKTTIIRIITKIFNEDAGEIKVDGMPIRQSKISFGYLPEERGLYPKVTVTEQLSFFARLKGMREQEIKSSIKYYLKRIDAHQHANAKLDTLSKGNQQKIQLVCALINNPDLLVLDEPFSGLDPVNSKILRDLIQEHVKRDKIVIFSSHQMSYVEEFCQNIAILNRGKIVCNGNISAIKKTYARDRIKISTSSDTASLCKKVNEMTDIVSNTIQIDNEIIVSLHEFKFKQKLFQAISSFDIDAFSVVEPTLEEIFVDKAGESYESI